MTRKDALTAVSLFLLLSTIYFATASGITSSNDGSHYALTRTLVENRRFTLDPFDPYAEGNDVAVRDGRLYSDRPPGTALAAALFYLAGGPLPDPLSPIPSRHDPDNPRLPYVLLLPVWSGAGTAVLLYLLLRRQQVSAAAALLAALMFALGTVQWKYSSVLFSHALSGFLVLLAVSLALDLTRRADAPGRRYALLGLVLGYSVLVEYSNALLVLLLGGAVLWRLRPLAPRRLAQTLLPFAAAGLLSALFLAAYNWVNFGSPLTLSYAYALNYPWAGEFRTTFSTPLLPGLRALLFFGEGGGWCGGPCYNQGLFLLSPVLLLALPGLWRYARRRGPEFWLTTPLFGVYLLLFATHHTAHGFTGDGRYLTPFLSLLAIPLAFTLDWQLAQPRSIRRVVLDLSVYGLFFLSMRNMLLHIGQSYNYSLDLAQLGPLAASPPVLTYLLRQLFPNAANLPLLWLATAILLLGGQMLRAIRQRRRLISR